MQPTPPPPPSDSDDIEKGFSILMGNIGYLRQQVEAYNKRPLPATEGQVKDLTDLAARDRPLVVNVKTEQVVEQLVGKVEQLAAAFQAKCNALIDLVDNRTDYLEKGLEEGVKAVTAALDALKAGAKDIPKTVPVSGDVYGFTNRITAGGTVVVSMLLGALLFWALPSSKVSKKVYAQLQAEKGKWQAWGNGQENEKEKAQQERTYYLNQVKKYKAKNPRTTDFPAYKPAK